MSVEALEMLRLKSEFDSVKEMGKKIVTAHFIMLYISSSHINARYGIICGRKFHKNAVVRNRARRIIKESLRHLQKNICRSDVLFIPKKGMTTLKQQVVEAEIMETLKRAGLWIEA